MAERYDGPRHVARRKHDAMPRELLRAPLRIGEVKVLVDPVKPWGSNPDEASHSFTIGGFEIRLA
jgi:hypothetical protein